MKKVLPFVLMFLVNFSFVHSQNTTDSATSKVIGIIKIHPLNLLVLDLRLGYEIPLGKKVNLDLGVDFEKGFNVGLDPSEVPFFQYFSDYEPVNYGFAIRPGIKIYPFEDATDIFLNPIIYVDYGYSDQRSNFYLPRTDLYKGYGGYILFGHTSHGKRIIFEPYIGIGYNHVFTIDKVYIGNVSSINLNEENLTYYLGFSIGYKIIKK